MPRLKHVPSFDGAFTHGETWDMEDGIFVVDDEDIAQEIVESYTKISYAEPSEEEENPTPEPNTDDYPTNDDGEPLCVGKEDGQCSRTVEELGGKCWQHS